MRIGHSRLSPASSPPRTCARRAADCSRPVVRAAASAARAQQSLAVQQSAGRPLPQQSSAKQAVLSHLLHLLPWGHHEELSQEERTKSQELLIETVERAVEVRPLSQQHADQLVHSFAIRTHF